MKRILILGAGRSSTSLIRHLSRHATIKDYYIRIGDLDVRILNERIENLARCEAFVFNIEDSEAAAIEISNSDLVISMLPAFMHLKVIGHCLKHRKSVITPSYVTQEIKALHDRAVESDVLILNEMGVDPGYDHMSAMEIVDRIRKDGGKVTGFESFTGGLVAPQSDNNPWNYKFTWNPLNVVLAGAGGAAGFLREGKVKYIPYHKLFERITKISIPDYGDFEGYANRDSLKYKSIYGLSDVRTLFRGTLRRAGFCRAWNVFVQLGMTDDSYIVNENGDLTYREFLNLFLDFDSVKSVEEKLRDYVGIDSAVLEKIEWLGLFSNESIGSEPTSPARLLLKCLESKWVFAPGDKDMIVMWHRITYETQGLRKEILASLVVEGEDEVYSAMANTVGLPVAIAAELILDGKLIDKGVVLPIKEHIYGPILRELANLGIKMKEYSN